MFWHLLSNLIQRETVMTILRMNGVGSGRPRKINPSENIHPREVESHERRELTTAFSTASILVATVAFGAVFTMPGGFKGDRTPVLLKHPAFAAFLIFNTLSMCFATVGGICFAVETFVRIYGRVWNVDLWGFFFSALAYKTMLITFMTAAYVVVAPSCWWLAIVVCLICSAPILFHYLLFAYQIFNYRPPVYTVVTSPLVNFFGKIVTKKLSS